MVSLKAAKHKNKQDSSDESEEENLNLLSKTFSKFLKRNRNKESNKERYENKKTSDFILTIIISLVVENKGI